MKENKLKDYVNEWLTYQPETGLLFWRKTATRGTRVSGREAGTTIINGYKSIKLQGSLQRVHRIAFLIMKQRLPTIIDHKDRDRSNNKWDNLREVSHQENCFNRTKDVRNKTGLTGVHFNTRENTYTVTYGNKYLGRSKSLFEAACLRKSEENKGNKC